MTIQEALSNIQIALKAPKSQYNSFGKYNYRNCEDILEAVKPLCREQKTTLTLSDSIVFIDGRHYVEATATLTDWTSGSAIAVKALAREEEDKKGMDGSQVTGASSSYARKYALNGLFNIDDTKDSDTTNTGGNEKKAVNSEAQNKSSATFTERAREYVIKSGKNEGKKLEELDELTLKSIIGYTKSDDMKKMCEAVLGWKEDKENEELTLADDGDLPF